MNKKKLINTITDNIKTLIGALVIAVIIRSLFFQPFYIPSSSMEPTLLVGDRLFVTKYSYGYSKHSFPFSPKFSNKRFFSKNPKRGDLVVFKETKALLMQYFWKKGDFEAVAVFAKTATDVLRLFAAVTGSDVSLSEKVAINIK